MTNEETSETKKLKTYTRMDVYEQVARWERYTEDFMRRFVDPVFENFSEERFNTFMTILLNLLGVVAVIAMFKLRK